MTRRFDHDPASGLYLPRAKHVEARAPRLCSGVMAHHSLLMGTGTITDPSFSSVKLLLHFDAGNGSTTITDSSGTPATCTANNGAACSTTRIQWGASSLFLDGTNDYISTNRGPSLASLFTVEAWVRPTGAQTGRVVSGQDSSSTNAVFMFRTQADGSLLLLIRNSSGTGGTVCQSAASLVAMNDTAWYHIAATRDGSNSCTIWLNGTSVATGTSSIDPAWPSRGIDIGAQYGTGEFYKGYIDDVRVTSGVCRYTGTFTPPTAAFPNS